MNFIKDIFKKKDTPIRSNEDFWNWFQTNQQSFYNVVKQRGNIEKIFFDKLSAKLNELKDGYFFLTGMLDDNTVELIITAEGIIKNIVFVEELIACAPQIVGWKFTALKPASIGKGFDVKMGEYEFGEKSLDFYVNEHRAYPDEIDITIVHNELNEQNRSIITNGIYVFIDNYIGELESVTTIDNINVVGRNDVEKELIPMHKLWDFLVWRQKEFIEKYEGIRRGTENDLYSMLSAELQNGRKLLAVINKDVLDWENKASHPWILNIDIKYNGKNNNGMPDNETYKLLDEIEEKILQELKDHEGFINIGRQTADNLRTIYFACNDLRKPAKVLQRVRDSYLATIDIGYDIYKDKYWRSFDRFNSGAVDEDDLN